MIWIFDTDACIRLINRSEGHEKALRRMSGRSYGEFLLSAVSVSELRCGVAKSRFRRQNESALDEFLQLFMMLDYPVNASEVYGTIRTDLERRGRNIGANDLLIAAHALCSGAALVTCNTREFSRIAGLRVEDWFM